MDRHLSTAPRNCELCGRQFFPWKLSLKTGNGKHCSRQCVKKAAVVPEDIRFFRNLGERTESGCRLWIGSFNPGGYGTVYRYAVGKRVRLAHRLSYELFIGPIPDGLHVLHRCDNPPCVQPAHLFLGTQSDNSNDMWAKNRGPRGEQAGNAKLTSEQVAEIRRLYATGFYLQADLGTDFGVSKSYISELVNRHKWKHV